MRIREEDEEAFIFYYFLLFLGVDLLIGTDDVAHAFEGVVDSQYLGHLLFFLLLFELLVLLVQFLLQVEQVDAPPFVRHGVPSSLDCFLISETSSRGVDGSASLFSYR